MEIEKTFNFLVKDYGLTHRYQEFHNCFGKGWYAYTHSYYNDTGCFTIHVLPQRGELDFYYSKSFSDMRENLCEKLINVTSIERNIWEKHKKFLFFKNPFFWWNGDKVLQALGEVVKSQIKNYNEFFGIKV